MRFISKYGRFGVQIIPMVQEAYATGMAKTIQEPVYASFEPWLLLPAEREFAVATWNFSGFYQLEDEVSIMPPDYRIGLFDSVIDQQTKGYSDEVRLEVERVLLANAALTDNIIVVPVTVHPAPWPRYDDFTGTTPQLIERLIEDGHDLDAVLAFEQSSQKRQDVIDALEALIADPDALLELMPEHEEIVG